MIADGGGGACSVMLDSVTPLTLAHQAPLSIDLPRQEYWSELLYAPPEDLSNQGSNPCLTSLLHCRQMLYHWAT